MNSNGPNFSNKVLVESVLIVSLETISPIDVSSKFDAMCAGSNVN